MYPNILRHPGPTPIPKKVELAMNQDMISHPQKSLLSCIKKQPIV